jgi:hypothetical protein
MPGSSGTDVIGQCSLCAQFFGKKVHESEKPEETELDKEIIKKGGAPSGMSSQPDDPSRMALISAAPSQPSAQRRRRRARNEQ